MNKEQQIEEVTVLAIGFQLESYVQELSEQERKGFYKGFSKCLKLQTIAITQQIGNYTLPDEVDGLHECILEEMVVQSEKDFEKVMRPIPVKS